MIEDTPVFPPPDPDTRGWPAPEPPSRSARPPVVVRVVDGRGGVLMEERRGGGPAAPDGRKLDGGRAVSWNGQVSVKLEELQTANNR